MSKPYTKICDKCKKEIRMEPPTAEVAHWSARNMTDNTVHLPGKGCIESTAAGHQGPAKDFPRKVYPNESNLYFGLKQVVECDLKAMNDLLALNEGWRLIRTIVESTVDTNGISRKSYILGRFPP